MIYQLLMKLGVFKMPPCRHVSRLSSRELDARLGFRDALMLRAHIAVCGVCKEYRRQLRILRMLLRQRLLRAPSPGSEPRLSDAARLRIRQALG